MPKKSLKSKEPIKLSSVGRRKEASALATLVPGKGVIQINGLPGDKYFSGVYFKSLLSRPFEATETQGKYDSFIRVSGGGKSGQLGAVILSIARTLVQIDPNFRGLLRKADLLTRDSRIRERRKVGMGGKSRRKKQSPKR